MACGVAWRPSFHVVLKKLGTSGNANVPISSCLMTFLPPSLSLYLRQRNQGHENEMPESELAMPYGSMCEDLGTTTVFLSPNIPVR